MTEGVPRWPSRQALAWPGPPARPLYRAHRSAGCHWPKVQGEMWPRVLRRSRWYMSPFTLSPRSLPSRSYTFTWLAPVTTRKASPAHTLCLLSQHERSPVAQPVACRADMRLQSAGCASPAA